MPDANGTVLQGIPTIPVLPGKGTQEEERRLGLLALFAVSDGAIQDALLATPAGRVSRFVDGFVAPVREWCRAHSGKIGACYLSLYERIPTVFVIGSSPGYDYALSDPLAELDLDLHRRGWTCQVLQLPAGNPGTLDAFIHREKAVRVDLAQAEPSEAQR